MTPDLGPLPAGPAADVTVVVVAWRSAATIGECLASVLSTPTRASLEVLVVDNDADEATRAELSRWGERVQVARQPRNGGFAGGVAAALEQVTTPYLMLLNDDAVAVEGTVDRLLDAMRAGPAGRRVAAAQPAVRLSGTVPPLVNTTGNMVSPDGYGYDRDWLRPWPPVRAADEAPFGFCGAGALLDVAAVRSCGGMDASLFLYYEDTDLSWRLRLSGWEVVYCPDAQVLHQHGSSSVEGSDLFLYHNERNRLLVLARNASVGTALRQWLRYPLTTASLLRAQGLSRSRLRVRVRAYLGALAALPATLRRRAGDRPTVSRQAVERLLRSPEETGRAYRSPDGSPAA